ncbi:hypothetical protein [Methylobacterium sp. 77]|uniref:hypothetical protein n=1 Tax=Methylobacterium sp. 77 TaxID=1101192 RepID=UPI000374B244|nr:hypothetical protein [Methylobacterium sp. 77]
MVPCAGLTPSTWPAIHATSLDFLDKHADEAGRRGWTTLQLFGVHPDLSVIRSKFCGAMVLGGGLASEVHADFIRFERTRFCRTIPGRPTGAVPIWAVKR